MHTPYMHECGSGIGEETSHACLQTYACLYMRSFFSGPTALPFSCPPELLLGLFYVAFLPLCLPSLSLSFFRSLLRSLFPFLALFSLLTKASHVQASEGEVCIEVRNFRAFSYFMSPPILSILAGEYLFCVKGLNDVSRQRKQHRQSYYVRA